MLELKKLMSYCVCVKCLSDEYSIFFYANGVQKGNPLGTL